MLLKFLVPVVVGALAGYLWHRVTQPLTGGACPLMCNPWRAMLVGATMGLLWAGTTASGLARGSDVTGLTTAPKEMTNMATVTKVASGVPVHVTESGFEALVRDTTQPILLDAYADWCGPCRMLAPELETVARDLADQVVVAKLNVDSNPNLAAALRVRSIPAMFVLQGGKVVESWTGYADAATLKERLAKHLAAK